MALGPGLYMNHSNSLKISSSYVYVQAAFCVYLKGENSTASLPYINITMLRIRYSLLTSKQSSHVMSSLRWESVMSYRLLSRIWSTLISVHNDKAYKDQCNTVLREITTGDTGGILSVFETGCCSLTSKV